MLPGDWDLAHAIRLGIKPFAELGANSETLSGSQVDSPCSCPSDPRIGPGSDATVSFLARKSREILRTIVQRGPTMRTMRTILKIPGSSAPKSSNANALDGHADDADDLFPLSSAERPNSEEEVFEL